jgi:hypothetical protein
MMDWSLGSPSPSSIVTPPSLLKKNTKKEKSVSNQIKKREEEQEESPSINELSSFDGKERNRGQSKTSIVYKSHQGNFQFI